MSTSTTPETQLDIDRTVMRTDDLGFVTPTSMRDRWPQLAAAVAAASESAHPSLPAVVALLERRLGCSLPDGPDGDDPPVVLARRFARAHARVGRRLSDSQDTRELLQLADETLALL